MAKYNQQRYAFNEILFTNSSQRSPQKFSLFVSAITGRDYGKVVKGEMAGLTSS